MSGAWQVWLALAYFGCAGTHKLGLAVRQIKFAATLRTLRPQQQDDSSDRIMKGLTM